MADIKVTGVCTVLENKLGKDWWKANYEEHSKIVQEYLKENDAHYYAKPKEDFFLWEAVEEAEALGKKEVVVEDMS